MVPRNEGMMANALLFKEWVVDEEFTETKTALHFAAHRPVDPATSSTPPTPAPTRPRPSGMMRAKNAIGLQTRTLSFD